MAVNRVDYNNNTLIDLTSDTVTAADLPAGVTAHDGSGTPITGTANYQPRTLDSSVTIGAETETTVEGAIGELADLVPSTASPQNPLATAGDVNGEEIIVTASTSPVSTASGSLRKITIYGKSEVVDGDIHSAGEGYAVVDLRTLNWTTRATNNGKKAFSAALPQNYIGAGERSLNWTSTPYNYQGNTNGGSLERTPLSSYEIGLYGYNDNVGEEINVIYAVTLDTESITGTLAYQLADPTQGNTIAVKTDNGSGIGGTMATFSTGTPLRGITGGAQDVATWDGMSGEVVKSCTKVNSSDLNWYWNSTDNAWQTNTLQNSIKTPTSNNIEPPPYITPNNYAIIAWANSWDDDKTTSVNMAGTLMIKDSNYDSNTQPDFDIIYELATPTTTPFTATENNSFAGLQTYSPQTAIAINDSPEFEVEAYAGTANGQAVADIQTDLQGQIDGITSQVNKNLSETEILAQVNDRIYQGTDLTVKFADEISASPYNGDPWAWIKARIQAENFAGIHVCDYIPVTTTNSATLNAQIAGINTYKNYGNSAVGSHIDFICKELWSPLRPVNKVNFNNGIAAQNCPWLASDLYLYLNSLAGTVPSAAEVGGGEGTAVDYTEGGVYYYLPTQLKNVIIEKRLLLPKRYSASGLLTDDNSWAWSNIGKLWLPDECEVYGVPVWGGEGGYSIGGSGLQYPLFAGNMNRLKFRNDSRENWWLLSPYSGNSAYWCAFDHEGYCSYAAAANSSFAAPVCFRVG